jgi:hypothetical protein
MTHYVFIGDKTVHSEWKGAHTVKVIKQLLSGASATVEFFDAYS